MEEWNMYVEMKHINKNFGDYEAAKDINFGVEQGRMVENG